MRVPDNDALRTLVEWRPVHGVISIYLEVDRADRSAGWRVALRAGLDQVVDRVADAEHDRRMATRATAERILERFDDEYPEGPPGRCGIAFIEVAQEPARETWMSSRIAPPATEVVHSDRPQLEPLVRLLDDGAPVGVLAISAERIRLFEWGLGFIDEIDSWEAGIGRTDWRERKAPGPRDPVHGQAVSASGKDQHDQRLDANRDRFLRSAARQARGEADQRTWRLLLALGNPDLVERFADGMDNANSLQIVDGGNVVSEDRGAIGARVEEALERLNRERERDLVERVETAALSHDRRGTLGIAPTQSALEEGRVEHLLLHADPSAERRRSAALDEIAEELIERAVRTDAQVTTVEGAAAEALAEHDGVAALLRY